MQNQPQNLIRTNGSAPALPEVQPEVKPDMAAPVADAAPSPAPALHDLITRLRDKWGHRKGWESVFSIPTVEDVPLEQTPLVGGLRALEEHSPVRASTLHQY